MSRLPTSPIADLSTIELTLENAPLLQEFFENNEAYFLATSGEAAGLNEAVDEISGQLPPDWGHTKQWVVGYVD